MTRRYQPDGSLLATALAGRVDALDEQARHTADDVAALGRGVADLTIQIRRLTSSAPDAPDADSQGLGADPADASPAAAPGQPDWLILTDPGIAADLLTGLCAWLDEVGAHYGLTGPPGMPSVLGAAPCWPLHPDVVTDLLALCVERTDAYAGERPTPVSEWHTRWLPAALRRVEAALAGCAAERGHRAAGRLWDATTLTTFDIASIAGWWATDRTTPAHIAFTLPALT